VCVCLYTTGIGLRKGTVVDTIEVFGNSVLREDIPGIMAGLDVLYCFLFLVAVYLMRFSRQIKVHDYKQKEIKVTNFSIYVTGLPAIFDDRLKLAHWIENLYGDVIDVALAYSDNELVGVYRKRGVAYKSALAALVRRDNDAFAARSHDVKKCDDEIEERTRVKRDRVLIGAYVTFARQESQLKSILDSDSSYYRYVCVCVCVYVFVCCYVRAILSA
jgi:hypothetical protein